MWLKESKSKNGVGDGFAHCHVNPTKTFNGRDPSSETVIPTSESGCEIQRKWV